MSDAEWTPKTLKDYCDRRFQDRDDALKSSIADLDRRLAALNAAHDCARKQERHLYSRDAHDVYATAVAEKLDTLQAQITQAEKPKWQIWIAAAVLTVGVVAGQWTLAIKPYDSRLITVEENQKVRLSQNLNERLSAAEKELQKQEAEHAGIKKLIDVVNARIDRLYELYRDLMTKQHGK